KSLENWTTEVFGENSPISKIHREKMKQDMLRRSTEAEKQMPRSLSRGLSSASSMFHLSEDEGEQEDNALDHGGGDGELQDTIANEPNQEAKAGAAEETRSRIDVKSRTTASSLQRRDQELEESSGEREGGQMNHLAEDEHDVLVSEASPSSLS
ncbi:unnamed protein product, partial [Amoebophrya sp. A25]